MSGRLAITQVAQSVPFDNDTNGFASDNVQAAIEEARDGVVGSSYQVLFTGNGTVGNEWLSTTTNTINSNQTSYIVPYMARLISITYTNSNTLTDPIVKFAISNSSSTTASIDSSYKWTLTDARVATEENETTGFVINAGERIGCYVEDGGRNGSDVVVILQFVITATIETPLLNFNYTGDMSSGDFPSTASMPRVFS